MALCLKNKQCLEQIKCPTLSFYCDHKITFCAPSGHKNKLCVFNIEYLASYSRIILLFNTPNLKIY